MNKGFCAIKAQNPFLPENDHTEQKNAQSPKSVAKNMVKIACILQAPKPTKIRFVTFGTL